MYLILIVALLANQNKVKLCEIVLFEDHNVCNLLHSQVIGKLHVKQRHAYRKPKLKMVYSNIISLGRDDAKS